jgi:hypothetical protein
VSDISRDQIDPPIVVQVSPRHGVPWTSDARKGHVRNGGNAVAVIAIERVAAAAVGASKRVTYTSASRRRRNPPPVR